MIHVPHSDENLSKRDEPQKPTFWLTIARQNSDHLILTLYDRQPIQGVAPLTLIRRPWPNDFVKRAEEIVTGPRGVDRDVQAIYGYVLAYWLFSTDLQAPTEEQIIQAVSSEPLAVSLNQIGERLKKSSMDVQESSRIRLFVCLEKSLFNLWEFLYITFFQSLSANQLVPLDAVRSVWSDHADSAQEPARVMRPVADRLRVLLVMSNPPIGGNKIPLPHLEDDFVALKETLDSLASDQVLDLVAIRQPSIEELEQGLRPRDPKANPHVFIFLGHGYDESSDKSAGAGLHCVDKKGAERGWNYGCLQAILREQEDAAKLRLVVFLACESFVAAPALLSLGVPAVVAMQRYLQHDFPSTCVVPFAKPLFEALAKFAPITTAFQEGVKRLHLATRRAAHDHLRIAPVMPTLWLAGQEDQLFAAEPQRLRTLYQTALLSKVTLCEWAGSNKKVTLEKVFVPPLLLDISTTKHVTCDELLSPVGPAVALEGADWSGKTTLAHWLVCKASASGKTPILVNLREMEIQKQMFEPWLLTSCRDRLGLNLAQEVANLIMAYCKATEAVKAVLVIDDVDPEWVTTPPCALRHRLFGDQAPSITAPMIVTVSEGVHAYDPDWTHLRIEPLRPDEQTELISKYGTAVDATPATEDFHRHFDVATQRPEGVTSLAGRPGFLADMLAQFLRQGVLLTEEADLLDRRQQHHWRTPTAGVPPIPPDEPVYKQRVVEALGFHLMVCQQAAEKGIPTGSIMKPLLQHMVLGDEPLYAPDLSEPFLDELVHVRPFLKNSAPDTWTFRSPEWLRFSAASQIASLVNDRDEAVLSWLNGTQSIKCGICKTKLAPFITLVDPARPEHVQTAIAAALAEDLPPWKRTDPWDCKQICELRRELVRALRLLSR